MSDEELRRVRMVVDLMLRFRVEGAGLLDKAVTELRNLRTVIETLPQSIQDDITDGMADAQKIRLMRKEKS